MLEDKLRQNSELTELNFSNAFRFVVHPYGVRDFCQKLYGDNLLMANLANTADLLKYMVGITFVARNIIQYYS